MSANTEKRRESLANWKIADPGSGGAIPVDRTGTVSLVSAGAESRSLAVPRKSDIEIALVGKTVAGTITITVASAYTEAGDTTLTVTQAGQIHILRSFEVAAGTFAWRLVASDPIEAMTIATLNATTVLSGNFQAAGHLNLIQSLFADGGPRVIEVVAETGQATNITTAVPITKFAGTFNTQASTLGAGLEQSFDVTNAGITVLDVPHIAAKYNGSGGTPLVYVSNVADGSFTIAISNLHASAALDGDFDINFIIFKQVLAE
jgi:hypothetical protein